jgi:flagellar biosynthesis/type III secretory pathway chaperone
VGAERRQSWEKTVTLHQIDQRIADRLGALSEENSMLKRQREDLLERVDRLKDRVEQLEVSKLTVGRIYERVAAGFDYALMIVKTYETPGGVVIEVAGSPSAKARS